MESLFTYGTLMCEDIMFQVAGHCERMSQAQIRNYQRRCVRGEDYPAIFYCPGSQVQGVVYTGLSNSAMQMLDQYEGEQYQRVRLAAEMPDGSAYPVFAYVIAPACLGHLSERDWSYEEFLQSGKQRFLQDYPGWFHSKG